MSPYEERRADDYDPGRLLTYAALFFVGVLIVFVSSIIGVQIWKSGEANTESWAALTGLIGWATSQVSIIFSNRFGTTQQAAKKDDVIARQANAVMAQASNNSTPPATDTVNVAAETVNVTPKGETP